MNLTKDQQCNRCEMCGSKTGNFCSKECGDLFQTLERAHRCH